MATVTAIEPAAVERPFTHYVQHQGRLFRPVLTLTSAYLFGAPRSTSERERLVAACTGLELIHLATLCHDDICDQAATRRGRPTVHAAFGTEAALVSGDYLLACGTSALATLGGRPARLAGDTLRELCRGQQLEMVDRYDVARTEEAYLSAISGKTAALMSAATRLGAALGGASEADQDTMAAFGHSLGLAFQIWDDVLDIWAPPGVTGKPPVKDIENGVYTLPVIYALRESWRHGGELPRVLKQRPATPDELDEVVRLLGELGVRERAVAVARHHVDEALAATRRVDCPPEAATALVEVARRLLPEIEPLLPTRPDTVSR
ncbi:polyprenyl synthetase family protein [Streptomyces chisholmiae]|nr:polyprenyl synthetase family protein [Streptomyces sp. DSM 44915]